MNAQTFFKGLFMMLIGVAVTYFSQTPIQWGLMAVTAIAVIISYTGKNLVPWFTSTSQSGHLNFINWISALLIAIATGMTDGIAMLVVEGHIVWLTLGKVVLGVTFTYIGSTLFAPPKSTAKKILS